LIHFYKRKKLLRMFSQRWISCPDDKFE